MEEAIRQIIYGKMPVIEAIKSGKPIEKIYIYSGFSRDLGKEVKSIISDLNIHIDYVPKERLNRFTQMNHQGIVAIINNFEYLQLAELCELPKLSNEIPFFIYLDQITDVRNFGAIARTALLTGCHGIIIPSEKSVSVNEDAIKSSAGALLLLPVCKVSSSSMCFDYLAKNEIFLYASDSHADKSLDAINLELPCCIILGSEGKGISKIVRQRMDDVFKLYQNEKLDSYNVSVSAGIICHELYKKRLN